MLFIECKNSLFTEYSQSAFGPTMPAGNIIPHISSFIEAIIDI